MAEGDDLTRLEQVRRRKRTDLKEGLVQAVMVQPLSLTEKIQKIELIDLMPDEAPAAPVRPPRGTLVRPPKPEPTGVPDPAETGPPRPPSGPPPLVDPGLPEHARVEHHRRRLGRLPAPAGLWAYLSREFPRILRRGTDTGHLTADWVPFRLKVSVEADFFLRTTLPTVVLPVLEQNLPAVRRTAWLVLTKTEYNLLAALGDLVGTLRGLAFPVKPRSWKAYWTALAPAVPGLVLFLTDGELVKKTERAWVQAAAKVGAMEKARGPGLESIRALFGPQPNSLVEIVGTLATLRCRKVGPLAALVPPEPGEYLAQDAFDAPPEVQAEIDRALAQLTDRMGSLAREYLDLRRIRYFVPDLPLLDTYTGGYDRSDRTAWARHFLGLARQSIVPLLSGTVEFAGGIHAEVLHAPPLEASCLRIGEIHDRMNDPLLSADPDLVGDAARVTMNLGKTLVVTLLGRSREADPLVRATDPEVPLDYEGEILEQPAAWAGLRVIDALVQAAQIGLLAGRFLGDTSLEGPLGKEEGLVTQADEILARIARMGPRSLAEEQRASWARARGNEA
jgi:hypothetical protein